MTRFPGMCHCVKTCGDDMGLEWREDVTDADDGTVCKGLPIPPARPLVEVVLIDRRTGEVIGRA